MKSKILVDLVSGFSHELPDDSKIRKIGRARDCGIKTLSGERGRNVSKYHACIVHEKGGAVYIWDTESKNGTYIERDGKLIQVFSREQVFPGEKIYLGLNYQMELGIEDVVAKRNVEQRERLRDTKTDKIDLSKF